MNTVAAAAIGEAPAPRLDRKRVYIFPSRAGFTFGAMLVIILMGAINYDNALAYLLAFLLGGMVMVAMLHTYRNLAGLRFLGARATPVFAGDRASFECLIENDSNRHRLQMFLKYWPKKLKRDERRYFSQFETRFDVAAASTSAVNITRDANRRGWLPLNRICLHSEYPLGILRSWAYFNTASRCLVYPRPAGHLPLPYAEHAATGRTSANIQGADDFASLRPYHPGDPVRAIAWKTLAKGQDLMIKRFSGQSTAQLALTWEAVAGAGHEEARLSQLTAWVLAAHRAGASYSLSLPDTQIALGHGPQHRDNCLRALALHGLEA